MMRAVIAVLLFMAAGWLGWRDWQATINEGQAYRLSSVEANWIALSPGTHEAWRPALEATEIPYLWDPVLRTLMVLPAAGILLFLGAILWLSRPRRQQSKGRLFR
jgi:hypothetical protein